MRITARAVMETVRSPCYDGRRTAASSRVSAVCESHARLEATAGCLLFKRRCRLIAMSTAKLIAGSTMLEQGPERRARAGAATSGYCGEGEFASTRHAAPTEIESS